MSYDVGHQIGNACWQLYETFSGRTVCILLDCKVLSSNRDVYNCSKPIWQGFFPCFLGVNDFPWEIVGLDLVNGLYGPEIHFTTIIDYIRVCNLT
jgi:hypothetical protein